MQYLGDHEQDLITMPPLAKRWKEKYAFNTLLYGEHLLPGFSAQIGQS